jgi:hypothetical protein
MPRSYQKFLKMLNFITKVCILIQTVMTGLTDAGAESGAPDAGGVVRVPSTDSASRPETGRVSDRRTEHSTCSR